MNTRSLWTFLRFLQRDFQVYRSMLLRYIVNNVLILPILVTFNDGYMMQQTLFGSGDAGLNTMRFAGSLLLPLLTLTFTLSIPLLFDFEHNRFIDYQITVLNPRLVLLERILFNTLFTFLLMAPFYLVSKLLLGSKFVTATTSWPSLFAMLFLGSLTAASYHILAMCVLPNSNMFLRLWARVSSPLFLLGGFAAPWKVLFEVSPAIARLMLCNPFMYISEGIRQAIIGGPQFFSLPLCMSMLVCFSALFYSAALWFFKKRLDHI